MRVRFLIFVMEEGHTSRRLAHCGSNNGSDCKGSSDRGGGESRNLNHNQKSKRDTQYIQITKFGQMVYSCEFSHTLTMRWLSMMTHRLRWT